MQRLLLLKQLASSFPKAPTSTTTTTTFSNTLTLHTKPTCQNALFSSFSKHPFHTTPSWRSQHSLPCENHAFLFNLLLVKRFLLCLSNTQMKKSFKDCKVWFLRAQFPKQNFHFSPNYGSHRLGWRSWLQRLTPNEVVLGLIIANVAVYLLWRIAGHKFMMNNFTLSLDNVLNGRLHTMITSAFSHVDLEHIASNMIGLYFFGQSIARTFGPEYLLKLYLAGAIGGSVFYLLHHAFLAWSSKGQSTLRMDHSRTPALGASGAVNAIMLLNIFLNPTSTIYFDFFIPVPAMLLGIFLIGKDVVRIIEGNSNISGSAHLGGAAVAALAWARIRKGRRF